MGTWIRPLAGGNNLRMLLELDKFRGLWILACLATVGPPVPLRYIGASTSYTHVQPQVKSQAVRVHVYRNAAGTLWTYLCIAADATCTNEHLLLT